MSTRTQIFGLTIALFLTLAPSGATTAASRASQRSLRETSSLTYAEAFERRPFLNAFDLRSTVSVAESAKLPSPLGISEKEIQNGAILIRDAISTSTSGTIHSGSAVVEESQTVDFGTGDIFYSMATSGSRGYLYSFHDSDPDLYFGDVISPSLCGPILGKDYPGHQGVDSICDFTDANDHYFTTESAVLFGDKESGCYQGILLFRQGGLYGGIEPVDVDENGDLHFNWWYHDSGNSDFSSVCRPTYSVAGRVTNASSNPVSDATVSAGTAGSTTTDAQGAYAITGLITGTYTLTPSKSGWTFNPQTRTVSVPPDASGQDFTGKGKVPYFSQRDRRWIEHPLRSQDDVCVKYCGDTIGECGCCLTSAAMVFNYYGSDRTPPSLSDCMDIWACPFYWYEGERCSQDHAQWQGSYSFSWGRLEDLLRQHPVLLKMTRGSEEQHWVLVLGGSGSDPANYIIHDPWPINGAAMKLNAYTVAGWQLTGLAVYTGQPVGARAVAVGTEQSVSSSLPPVVVANPEGSAQEEVVTVAEAQDLSASSVVTGSALLYRMTDVTMTVQLTATSTAGSIAEMLLWTDSMTETSWQPFSTKAQLSASELIYVRFRDTADNVSSTAEETRFPVHGPPSPPWDVFLPLVLRQGDS